MDRLGLSRGLRVTLDSVHRTGGDPDLRAEVRYDTLARLRDYVFQRFQGLKLTNEITRRFEFQTLMEPQWFHRAVRFAVVFLRQSGVPESKHRELLTAALEISIAAILDGKSQWKRGAPLGHEGADIEMLVAAKLTSCFQAGYFPDSIAHYDLLDEHGLILWNSRVEVWELTSLGRYAKDLSLFSLLLFLLGVQLTLSRERSHSRYLTPKLLDRLLVAGEEDQVVDQRDLPRTLLGFGVVDFGEGRDCHLSRFGFQLLSTARARQEQLRDLVLLLLETDAHGFGSTGLEQKTTIQAQDLLADRIPSFQQVKILAEGGRYLDALKLLYPEIEAFLNNLLAENGVSAARMGGMHKKFEELRRLGRITPRVGYWGEIVVSRNKIAHGNIQDGADDLCEPLFRLVVGFFGQLIKEADSVDDP
jgi:hypothetical protein